MEYDIIYFKEGGKMYIKRQMTEIIRSQSDNFPVVLVTGPRQVGKTTLLKEIKEENREYVTLDDPIEREMAVNQPELFIRLHKPPVIIDEIQYAPGLFQYIKMEVDKENIDGMYWLASSHIFTIIKNIGDSLAGRVLVLRLHGISQDEESGVFSFPFPETPLINIWNLTKET